MACEGERSNFRKQTKSHLSHSTRPCLHLVDGCVSNPSNKQDEETQLDPNVGHGQRGQEQIDSYSQLNSLCSIQNSCTLHPAHLMRWQSGLSTFPVRLKDASRLKLAPYKIMFDYIGLYNEGEKKHRKCQLGFTVLIAGNV